MKNTELNDDRSLGSLIMIVACYDSFGGPNKSVISDVERWIEKVGLHYRIFLNSK